MADKLTEKDIQLALYHYRACITAFPVMVPNVYLWYWESDLLYLTRAHHVVEYEIKVTHSDFLADLKYKQTKHRHIQNGSGPTEFYFVCPEGVISKEELPSYAGLLYVKSFNNHPYNPSNRRTGNYVMVEQKAKRQKRKALNEKQVFELLKKGVARYWSLQSHTFNNGGHCG